MPRVPDRPDLVALDGAGNPLLRVARCQRCDARTFPPQRLGCEHCGAPGDDLVEEQRPPTGTVLARATVHRDLFGRPVPYTIIELALDGGPALRGRLATPTSEGCAIGSRVHGVLAEGDDQGEGQGEGEGDDDTPAELVFVPGGPA